MRPLRPRRWPRVLTGPASDQVRRGGAVALHDGGRSAARDVRPRADATTGFFPRGLGWRCVSLPGGARTGAGWWAAFFGVGFSFLLGRVCLGAADTTQVIADPSGLLGDTAAPAALSLSLSPESRASVQEGTMAVVDRSSGPPEQPVNLLPVQWELTPTGARGVMLMPRFGPGARLFGVSYSGKPFSAVMQVKANAGSGSIEIAEQGRPVLSYQYRPVEPGAVLDQVAPANRIYARARSDYLHPFYGLHGEVLTRDWPIDHPHHRGIYWAWPEVEFGRERGDLHALQQVFARPTGRVEVESGPVFAQIRAENRWWWADHEAIVTEVAVIRAYRAAVEGRVVDLAFQFVALKPGVTLARRETTHYGGLNVRLATPRDQAIVTHTDPATATPRRAWSDLSGFFAAQASGLTVLQSPANPEYPGDWVQYPELSWCQPTFPASGTRYSLRPGEPLVLRFRLWVHAGPRGTDEWNAKLWDALAAPTTPLLTFGFRAPAPKE